MGVGGRGGEAGVKEDLFTRGLHKSVRGRGSRDGGKTAYEMFLEDDGPYSRKLYPPLTPGNAIKITVYSVHCTHLSASKPRPS